MKRIAILLLPICLMLAAPVAVEAASIKAAKQKVQDWRQRVQSRKLRYYKAGGKYLYWSRTLDQLRKSEAPREEREAAKKNKAKWGKDSRRKWKDIREAQKKLELWKKRAQPLQLSPRALRRVMTSLSGAAARSHAKNLAQAMQKYKINNRKRGSMFIAQIAHESGELRYTREIWGPTAIQRTYAYRLGNNGMGDAYAYRGGGYIQVTGKSNYQGAARGTGLPLVKKPNLLSKPRYAALVSAWWWASHGLNGVADSGDFRRVTLIINGGYNGLSQRLMYYGRARNVAEGLVPRRR